MNFPQIDGVYDHLIVHCSATKASQDLGASWIDRVHRRKGWSMCGYHIVITRSGEIQWSGTGHRTRPIDKTGSHVGGCGKGWNQRSLGVCLIGGVKEDGHTPENNFTEAQLKALRQVIAEAVDAFGIPEENVMGHRDLIKMTKAAPKACPCFSVRGFLGEDQGSNWFSAIYDTVRDAFAWDRDNHPPHPRGETLVTPMRYTVRKGDTLYSISQTYGVPLWKLRELNKIKDDTSIAIGSKLRLHN